MGKESGNGERRKEERSPALTWRSFGVLGSCLSSSSVISNAFRGGNDFINIIARSSVSDTLLC